MNSPAPRDRDPVPRFLGWALMAVGVLWVALAGICTISVLMDSASDANAQALRSLFGVIGGVTTLAGFGVFMLGRWLARN
jgi:hypothetical protein